MDPKTISDILDIPVDKVRQVCKTLNAEQVEQAVATYLDNKSGAFKEEPRNDPTAWAESGKPRRPKKVRAPCRQRRLIS